MNKTSKIYVAGHNGMAGSAILRKLNSEGYVNIITRSSGELDLRAQKKVRDFFETEKPEYVFIGAAKVGGIHANNTYRAEFIYDNLMIQCNVIHFASLTGVKKLLFLGSSCMYPRQAPQPIKEEYLLSAPLEPTNEPYAVAKIAGIKMCQAYRSQYGCNFIMLMPTNLYGPNDNYDLENSHVLPALLRKFYTAREENLPYVEVWGTGNPAREFLHVDDLADACLFMMLHYNEPGIINIGSGKDITIRDLALLIKKITGYKGDIRFDNTKPDGTMRKLLDISKINALGWNHTISLEQGIKQVFLEIQNSGIFA